MKAITYCHTVGDSGLGDEVSTLLSVPRYLCSTLGTDRRRESVARSSLCKTFTRFASPFWGEAAESGDHFAILPRLLDPHGEEPFDGSRCLERFTKALGRLASTSSTTRFWARHSARSIASGAVHAGVARPKTLNTTLTFPGSTPSTTPENVANGPPIPRTFSPDAKEGSVGLIC